MIGITSYRDLKYWEDIHRPEEEHVYPTVNFNSFNRSNVTELLIAGSPRIGNSYRTVTTKSVDDYHGCYVILLGNLFNETKALELVLDNYQYLNSRTRDVRFFMPGFTVIKDGVVASRATSHIKKFDFDTDGFLDTIDWLEEGNPDYNYSEDMELILLPYDKSNGETVYDFLHMLSYNLDELLDQGKNIIQFFSRAVQVVQRKMSFKQRKVVMEGISSDLQPKTHKVFIAGSTVLEQERDSIRSEFSKLSNRGDTLHRVWTFEDFERSFNETGRQTDYNKFIEDEADSVVFILSDRIGGITLQEFNVAMRAFERNGHPRIHVYCQGLDEGIENPDIQRIVDEINNHHQYYTRYSNISNLKDQIFRDFR